jgi:hypothetical protein
MKICAGLAALAGCTTVDMHNDKLSGTPPLCRPGVQLGKVAVAPLTHWRADQKEPPVREAIAEAAMRDAFAGLPCATSVEYLKIRSDSQAQTSVDEAKASGASALVSITVHELGPIFVLSFPALWSGWSDVVFDIDAVDLPSGAQRFSVSRGRRVGGAFEVRGLWPLQGEFSKALQPLLTGG